MSTSRLGVLGRRDVVEAPAIWRVALSMVFSLAGLGISIYLTVAHFVGTQVLACSATGVVNCEKVTTSAQSYFPPNTSWGVPVAVLGMAFYVVMTAVNLPFSWRAQDQRVHIARLAIAALGTCFALYLVAAELLIIGNICLWCTSVHLITFALFVLIIATVPAMLGWGTRDRT